LGKEEGESLDSEGRGKRGENGGFTGGSGTIRLPVQGNGLRIKKESLNTITRKRSKIGTGGPSLTSG